MKLIRAFTKRNLEKMLVKFGHQLQPWIVLAPWDDDKLFNNIRMHVIGYTLVGKVHCYMIYQRAKQVAGLKGDVAEVGVYKGGTARLLAGTFDKTGKTVHLFDTFSGMPDTDFAKDFHKEGDFSDTSLEDVENYLHDCQNVRFYKGIFPATAEPVARNTFCLVHIDVDIYQSVRDCCEFFYPRVEQGGIMIFDDYGVLDCPGAKMAVDEFFSDKPESPCYLTTGQCVITRL